MAIVLVVLLHSADWLEVAHLDVGFWGQFNHVVNGLRMPLFFAVSGLLGAKWSTARWPALFSGKVTFLLWAYFMWQPIGSVIGLVVNQIKGDPTEPVRMLTSLLATPVRPRLELWFLWALAVSFVVARLSRRVPVPVQLGVAGVLSAVWLSDLVPPGNPGWDGWPSYYVFFLIGMHHRPLLVTWTERARAFRTRAKLVVAGWGVLATAVFLTRVDRLPGPSIAIRLVGLAAGLSLAALLAGRPLVRYFGSHTLPIYLAHTPLIVLCVRVLQLNQGAGWVETLRPVLPILLTTVVVPLTLLLHAALIRTPFKVLYTPPRWVLVQVSAFCSRLGAGRAHPASRDAQEPQRPAQPWQPPVAPVAPAAFAPTAFPAAAAPAAFAPAATPAAFAPAAAPAAFAQPGAPAAGRPSPYVLPPAPESPYLGTALPASAYPLPPAPESPYLGTSLPASPQQASPQQAAPYPALPHPAPPPPMSPYQGMPYPTSPYVVDQLP